MRPSSCERRTAKDADFMSARPVESPKAAIVSNLMVVLCGDSEVRPVVNTGTLYT